MPHGIPLQDGGGELVAPAGETGEEQASSPCLATRGDVQWHLSPRQVNIHREIKTQGEPK